MLAQDPFEVLHVTSRAVLDLLPLLQADGWLRAGREGEPPVFWTAGYELNLCFAGEVHPLTNAQSRLTEEAAERLRRACPRWLVGNTYRKIEMVDAENGPRRAVERALYDKQPALPGGDVPDRISRWTRILRDDEKWCMPIVLLAKAREVMDPSRSEVGADGTVPVVRTLAYHGRGVSCRPDEWMTPGHVRIPLSAVEILDPDTDIGRARMDAMRHPQNPRSSGTHADHPAVHDVLNVPVDRMWRHPATERLVELLSRAYSDEDSAIRLAEKANILTGRLRRGAGILPLWESLWESTAKQGKRHSLILRVLDDPYIAGYHGDLRALIGLASA